MKDRLKSVLRIRRVQERQRLGALGAAEQDVAAADDVRRQRVQERVSWMVPLGSGMDGRSLRRGQLEYLALYDAEAAAEADLAVAMTRRDQRRNEWSQARVSLRSVERLAEHRAAIAAAEAAARAQAAADEQALMMRKTKP